MVVVSKAIYIVYVSLLITENEVLRKMAQKLSITRLVLSVCQALSFGSDFGLGEFNE